jgi:ADP-heptose:LPS heptosyltransferase
MLLAMSETSGSPGARPIAVLVDREGLGDCLLKFPFLRAIRRGFPGRPIWWIATHQTSMADELAPFVTKLIDRVVHHAGLTGRSAEVRARLKALPPFDLVFEARTHIPSVLLSKTLLTYNGFFCCLPGYVLSDRRPPGRWRRPDGVGARMLSLAEAALGKPPDWQGTLEVSPAASALAEQRLPAGPRYVGLAIGSREVRKNWPVERYIALAKALEQDGAVPVFLIGPQERETLARLRAAVPSALFPEAEPPDPALKLARLEFAIALCTRLTAAVANDSGIGHLLGAIGTPLVTLFGPSDAARWAPFTANGIVIRAQEFGGDAMDAIPVEPVLQAVGRVTARA